MRAHPHRKLAEVVADLQLTLHVLEDVAQPLEVQTQLAGLGISRGHGHQAAQADAVPLGEVLDEVRSGADGDSELALLSAGVDLQENVHGAAEAMGLLVELLGKAEAVDAVDRLAPGQDQLDLVPLEMADHVPARAGDAGVAAA